MKKWRRGEAMDQNKHFFVGISKLAKKYLNLYPALHLLFCKVLIITNIKSRSMYLHKITCNGLIAFILHRFVALLSLSCYFYFVRINYRWWYLIRFGDESVSFQFFWEKILLLLLILSRLTPIAIVSYRIGDTTIILPH